MNHASLFSGIGGAEVAASMMGWKNLFHCEIQEFPRKVLDYWFPNSESYEDITKTDFTKWGVRSMFSQEDSHANLSPSQVEERERTITVTSGLRCFERYGRYTPLGSLVKTLLASRRWWSPAKSLRWDAQTIFSRRITYTVRKAGSPSTKSVQTSKPKDIPSNRLLFQLVPSEHRTEEIESGLLPTPNAMDIPHKNMEINGRGRRNPKKGKTDHSLGLEDMAVAQLLPTPTACDKGSGRINKSPSTGAAEQIAHKIGGGTSQLNPLFVEEMMGFPLMWTALPFLSPNGDKSP